MQHANSDLHVLCLAQFHLGPSFQLCLATGFVGLAHDRDDRVVGVAMVHVVIGVHGKALENSRTTTRLTW